MIMTKARSSNTVQLALAAMCTALTVVATMIVRVPAVGTGGYINLGDAAVLLTAWFLGGWYGAAAAGLGSALADVFAGYALYAPGTFVIKFLMALVAWQMVRERSRQNWYWYLLAAVLAEIIMVGGYFLYESTLLRFSWGAAASVPGNGVQGVTGLALALLLNEVLGRVPAVQQWKDTNHHV